MARERRLLSELATTAALQFRGRFRIPFLFLEEQAGESSQDCTPSMFPFCRTAMASMASVYGDCSNKHDSYVSSLSPLR